MAWKRTSGPVAAWPLPFWSSVSARRHPPFDVAAHFVFFFCSSFWSNPPSTPQIRVFQSAVKEPHKWVTNPLSHLDKCGPFNIPPPTNTHITHKHLTDDDLSSHAKANSGGIFSGPDAMLKCRKTLYCFFLQRIKTWVSFMCVKNITAQVHITSPLNSPSEKTSSWTATHYIPDRHQSYCVNTTSIDHITMAKPPN